MNHNRSSDVGIRTAHSARSVSPNIEESVGIRISAACPSTSSEDHSDLCDFEHIGHVADQSFWSETRPASIVDVVGVTVAGARQDGAISSVV